jgi:hypothetical protein
MKWIFYLIVTIILLYLFLLLFVYAFQQRMVFQPIRLPTQFAYPFTAPFEEHWLDTEDGERINALYFPAAARSRGIILYLHGNKGNLQRWAAYHETFNRMEYDFFIFDYRGFGKSSGSPSEEGIYKDSEAAYKWIKQRHPEKEVIIYGRSLGTGPACYLAETQAARQLILETPFTSMSCVVRSKALFPIPGSLLKFEFPNQERLSSIHLPVHIFMAGADRLIPASCTFPLAALIPEGNFITIEGGGHKNLSSFPEYHYWLEKMLDAPD